jgi:release factor glutamine methyltransferase
MQIPSNKIEDIKSFFIKELALLYDTEEANAIFFHAIDFLFQISKNDYIINKSKTISESELLKIHFVLKDLKKGIPLQYVLGETQFMGLNLKVNSSVLIPRQETEELVDWIIQSHKKNELNKILDIGTGSGCIALALKKYFRNVEVHAVDVSEDALKIAQENALKNDLQIIFHQIDIFSDGFKLPQNLDLLVSNPPYVKKSETNTMHPNVLNYEPHLALFVPDDDALIFYKRICELAKRYLREKAWLYFEINQNLAEEMNQLLTKYNFKNIELKKDISGNFRMIRGEL